MESKRRCGKKRTRETDYGDKPDLEGKIVTSTKRRKNAKHDFRIRKSVRNNNTKAFKNLGTGDTADKTMTTSRMSFVDADSNVCIGSSQSKSSDNRVQCLASRVRKTYASSSSRRHPRKDRSKLRGNLRSKLSLTSSSKGSSEGTHEKWEREIEVSKDGCESLSPIYAEAGRTERASEGNPETDGSVLEDASIENANSTRKSRQGESDIQIITHSSYDKRKGNELAVNQNQELSPSCAQQMRLSPGSVTSIVFSTIPSQPHIMASPVACPMTPILCHSSSPGVNLMPMQSMGASTSAISSVSTPVVSLPLLPDATQDVSGNLGHSSSTPNSLLRSFLKSDLHGGYQATNDTSLEGENFSASGVQNQVMVDSNNVIFERNHSHVAASNGESLEIHPSDHSAIESLEVHGTKIPLISIEDDCETLLIEKGSEPLVIDSSSKSSLHKMDADDNPGVSGSDSENTVTTLKVDNWASYLLQRLEMLFDREEECDLILRFSSGEILKAHRTIISACTSLLSQPRQPEELQSEIAVPPELDYASVESVLRFVYSGRLDVRGSKKQLSAIYIASQRLQVSLLTRLMDRRFPHLTPNRQNSTRQQVFKKTEKAGKYPKQKHAKGNPRSSNAIPSISGSPSGRHKVKNNGKSDGISRENGDISNLKDDMHGTLTGEEEGGEVEEEEDGGQDGSLYFLVTNSQKIAQANAAVRRKRPAETARPTRFELEEEVENHSVQISTWSSKSTLPPYYPSSSCEGQESSISVSTPVSDSTVSVTSPNSAVKNTNVTWSSAAVSSDLPSDVNSREVSGVRPTPQSQDPFSVLSHDMYEKNSSNTLEHTPNGKLCVQSGSNSDCQESPHKDDESMEEEDAGKESEELMEKISNICKQLEDGESDENESSCEEVYDTRYPKGNTETPSSNGQSNSSQMDVEENFPENNDCILLDSPSTPTKSILKKKKEKSNSAKVKKRVSFPLDENNELINEVATYSNSKEPAQSLIDVQKTVGSFRSSEDSPSPVKLTLSLKKKVLMNLALDDTEGGESHSGHENERGKSKKAGISSGQSTSQGIISQGDMSNHAKIISEVLKKYPHLVKDRKNIRLKILKKGSDKSSSGKLVKSKVQYLVLSENEHKSKSSTKHDKNSASGAKADSNSSSRAPQNAQKFGCPECEDVAFRSYFTFKKHVTSEHKDKSSSILASIENVPYACYTCFVNEPLEFADYCSYQQHMKEVHSKREARLCSICGYRPARKLELAYHQYIEHNKLPRNVTFPKCDLCDHVAMNDAALLKHRSQHANADNYTCSVCGVAFRSFGALQGHMQTKLCQNKPSVSHKCPYCPQTFARSYNLKAHCKSSHRAAHIAAQAASSSAGEIKHQETMSTSIAASKNPEETIPEGSSGSGLIVEHVCETLTSMSHSQSSSEAEALSTVANSLAASLGLPEETVNHYMYAQGSKLDFTGDLENEKYEESVARASEVNTHLMESAASVPGYSGNLPLCHDGTYTSQSPISTTTTVGTFYPVGVVPGQLVPGQLVSGEILPSQVLPGTCVNVAGNTMLGAPPHSWTYVTYQVPTSGEDIPSVMADTSNMTTVGADQSTMGGVEMPLAMKSSKNESVNGSNSRGNGSEPTNPLVLMTNTATQVSISHASHISTPQSYDAFSSQFV